MKVKKTVLAQLNKCYAVAPLFYQGKRQFVVAAEKADPCYLFDQDGTLQDTLWTEPGGVMTMVQVPGTDGQLLSTAKFYSPDESLEAKLVVVTPEEKGRWSMHTLTPIPHVHRFDILSRGGVNWLIVCTVKSGQDHPNGDWSYPGKVYTAILPEDLSAFDDAHPLKLQVLKDGLHRNHGYTRCDRNGIPACLIAADEGVWRLTPPETADGEWQQELLLGVPVSDAVLVDLDEDGQDELCTLSPFHGERISVYHRKDGDYERVWSLDEDAPFTHAICGGIIAGVPTFVAGYRAGKKNLMAIRWDGDRQDYAVTLIDEGRGPANVMHFVNDAGVDVLIATNRETDEVAMYEITG
ncbi:MAG: hypothetical protein ABS900_02285 [Candidatus Limivicinus sp.]